MQKISKKNIQKVANFQVYLTNLANPGRIWTIRMTLKIIFVLIIITHARGFESIKIFGGEGDLAAPYCNTKAEADCATEYENKQQGVHSPGRGRRHSDT